MTGKAPVIVKRIAGIGFPMIAWRIMGSPGLRPPAYSRHIDDDYLEACGIDAAEAKRIAEEWIAAHPNVDYAAGVLTIRYPFPGCPV